MATKTKRKKKSISDLNAEVTDRIITALEEDGIAPWKRPWVTLDAHQNWVSKKPYRGINQFLLNLTSHARGYTSPYWLTYKQAEKESYKQWRKENGLTVTLDKNFKRTAEYKQYRDSDGYKGVRSGEKGETVYLFRPFLIQKKDKSGEPVTNEFGKPELIRLFDIKYFTVFNAEQTDLNLPVPQLTREHTPIEEAQEVIKGYKDCPKISHGGDSAFYRPRADLIGMPKPESFDTDEHYYATLFHECIHSTGHESRTHRVKDWTGFGSDPYAREELVAELGAAILSGYAGIDVPDVQQGNESYIKSWIQRFKDDNTLLLSAGAKAQGAVDWILGTKFEEGDNQ